MQNQSAYYVSVYCWNPALSFENGYDTVEEAKAAYEEKLHYLEPESYFGKAAKLVVLTQGRIGFGQTRIERQFWDGRK